MFSPAAVLFLQEKVLREVSDFSRVLGVGGGIRIDPLPKVYINGGKEPGRYAFKG
jgi:hypothetical protein